MALQLEASREGCSTKGISGSRAGSKESVQSEGALDDNFAFIEQLLDTLQTEGKQVQQESDSSVLRKHSDNLSELAGAGDQASVADDSAANPEQETWSTLLNRFCEDGDESLVDTLLDNFLKNSGDVGNMIDEIDRKARPTAAVQTPGGSQLYLDLGHLQGQDFGSPSLQTWEALINSARGLLNSARTSHSLASVPSGPLVDSMQATAATRGAGSEAGVGPSCWGKKSGDPDEELQCEQIDGREPEEPQEDGEHAAESAHYSSKAEILAKLAATDSPEAMRRFMKSFLLGVRQRYISGYLNEKTGGGDAGDGSDGSDEDSDGSTSCWTCRSVSNVNTDPFED